MPIPVLTAAGQIDLLNPVFTPDQFAAIAGQLSRINRWAGATCSPISVAQHSCLVADLCPPEARPFALIHDAHEICLGDIPQPVKIALCHLQSGEGMNRIQSALDAAITNAAGLPWPWPLEIAQEVKNADLRALTTEMRDLFADHEIPPLLADYPPANRILRPQPWAQAEAKLREQMELHLPALMGYTLEAAQ